MSRARQNYLKVLKKISSLFIGDNFIFCVGELHNTGLWLVSFLQISFKMKTRLSKSKNILVFGFQCASRIRFWWFSRCIWSWNDFNILDTLCLRTTFRMWYDTFIIWRIRVYFNTWNSKNFSRSHHWFDRKKFDWSFGYFVIFSCSSIPIYNKYHSFTSLILRTLLKLTIKQIWKKFAIPSFPCDLK